jgi:hypothetical protein
MCGAADDDKPVVAHSDVQHSWTNDDKVVVAPLCGARRAVVGLEWLNK